MKVGRGILLAAALCCLQATMPSAAAATDPVMREWPSWPYQVTCGKLPFDPASVFSGPADAELGSQPSAGALRDFLAKGSLPWHRPGNWRLLAEDERYAEYGNRAPSGEMQWLLFENVEGTWKWVNFSTNCHPTSIVERGPVIRWALAPEQLPLSAATRRIRVELSGGPCSGGRSLNRHAHFSFHALGRKLLMAAWIDPIGPGPHTCQALIEPSRYVRLPGRLGNRVLFEAGTYPPVSAGQTRERRR